ncbi:NUDIX domain-containing protein [Naumannella sp. ID2617S]|nr:NUDIX domain-containing protein [Naumannella sp. ID2617S]
MRLVVAAVLRRGDRVLACRRTRPEALAGLWEFPGGKGEPGEAPEDALVRELAEELGVNVRLGPELVAAQGMWPISTKLAMRVWWAETEGEAVAGESHDLVRWVGRGEFGELEWVPADVAIAALVADSLTG